jgi:hypothetical protein
VGDLLAHFILSSRVTSDFSLGRLIDEEKISIAQPRDQGSPSLAEKAHSRD